MNLQDLFDKQTKLDWREHYEVSKETKLQVGASKRGRPAHNRRAIMTPLGQFPSLTAFAQADNITVPQVCARIKSHPQLYYYLDRKG